MVPWRHDNRLVIFSKGWGNYFGVMEFFPQEYSGKIVLKDVRNQSDNSTLAGTQLSFLALQRRPYRQNSRTPHSGDW